VGLRKKHTNKCMVHTYLQTRLGSDERLEPHWCGAHEHVVVRVQVPDEGRGVGVMAKSRKTQDMRPR
jgi:hypothetical protein